jgi:hypothetical protein
MALVADLFDRSERELPGQRQTERTQLRVVPGPRRTAGFVAVVVILSVVMMLGAAMLHTELAARQLEIDRLEVQVASQQERFDELRAQRAVLRSPGRLGDAAWALGMRPMERSEFALVDPWDVARSIAATAEVLTIIEDPTTSAPLEQFRLVKSVSHEGP